jgi:hypothetical protein
MLKPHWLVSAVINQGVFAPYQIVTVNLGPRGRIVDQADSRRFSTAMARVRVRGQVMWDLWWTKRQCDRFSPADYSTDYYTFIIIHYRAGLVQQAK